jgi:N-acetylmuramoyl-L-alanine amidase
VTDLAMRERPSPNHGPRRANAPVDMLIIHYTGMDSAAAALDRLCDPTSEVSAHHMIDEDGTVWRLVPEDRRAWHAGRSFWAGETDINSRSIGIELVNPGHGLDYRAFPDAQMKALERLCHGILCRFPIRSHFVLGHADVAPGRKLDPGELFDWRRLAAAGIGLWPDNPVAADSRTFADDMRRFGYADASTEAIAAFQQHFRPTDVTGIADDETRARLAALVMQAGLA